MRKFKVILWILLVAVVGMFFYQNKDFFLSKPSLTFQVPFFEVYHIPQIPNALSFVAFFVLGLLIAYFFGLLERFKSNRTLKTKEATISAQMEEIAALKSRLDKGPTSPPTGSETLEPPKTPKESEPVIPEPQKG